MNTFRDGIELFLEGEGEKKLPQPRRANACCGRIVEVPFKEKGSDQVKLRTESIPCKSNKHPSIDPISWDQLALSLHDGESALKPAEKCECPSLTLPTKADDLCPGLPFIDACIGRNQNLGMSPVNGVCATCRNTFVREVKQKKRGFVQAKQFFIKFFTKRGSTNRFFLDDQPIVCIPRSPPRRVVPHEIFTSDPFCGLCGRSLPVPKVIYTAANPTCGENNEFSEWAGRLPFNGSEQRRSARQNLQGQIFPSVLTLLHDAVAKEAPVKLSPTPHCCEQCAGRALAVMVDSFEETLKAAKIEMLEVISDEMSEVINTLYTGFVDGGAKAVKNALENGVFDTKVPIHIGEPGFAPNPVQLSHNQSVFKVPKNYPKGRFRLVLYVQRQSGQGRSDSKQTWHWCYDNVAHVGRLIRSATKSLVIPGELENGDPAEMIIDPEFWFDARSFDFPPTHRTSSRDDADHHFLPGFPDVVNYVNYVCEKYPLCTPTIFINSPGDLTGSVWILFYMLKLFKFPKRVHIVWINSGEGFGELGTGTVSVYALLKFISERKNPKGSYEGEGEEGDKMSSRLLTSIDNTKTEPIRCSSQKQRVATFQETISSVGFGEVSIDKFKCAIVDYEGERIESVVPNEDAPREYFTSEGLGKVVRKANFQSENKKVWSNPNKKR